MMYWYGPGMGGWGYALMALSMLLFWGLIIGAIVALVRYLRDAGPTSPAVTTPKSPEQILADRFARGEIDEEEYQRRLAVLRYPVTP
jgi:putative membrane protein